jgi:hypothetical protein
MNEQKMYYNGREVIMVENTQELIIDKLCCDGCVLAEENWCVRAITPPQSNNVCCPKHTKKFYIFKFKENV